MLIVFFSFSSCGNRKAAGDIPTVGFIEAFEDATIAEAKSGFIQALADSGYSEEKGSVTILQRNAQGDMNTLNQIISYLLSEQVDLVGTSTTLATLAAVKRIKEIPIFMTVTATPELLGLTKGGQPSPANLLGVAEDLNYIDTSFMIIKQFVKGRGEPLRIGMVYNQAEPQSVNAYKRIEQLATDEGMLLVAKPLNTSADAHMVARSLLSGNIDAFFANPDNTVFASFETILKACHDRNVPIFTSEMGLVARGAVAAYGADLYKWGYQSGAQAAHFLKGGGQRYPQLEMVKVRKKVFNDIAAKQYGLVFPEPLFERVR